MTRLAYTLFGSSWMKKLDDQTRLNLDDWRALLTSHPPKTKRVGEFNPYSILH